MNKEKIIPYYSGEKLRIRKDGQPDRRYKYGKKFSTERVNKGYVGRSIPRKPKNPTFLEKLASIFMLFGLIAFTVWASLEDAPETYHNLFRTTAPRTAYALESNLGASRAYLEDPRSIEEIKDYMRYKFGDNYQVACMVAYSEGLRSNWVNRTMRETSVGVLQINIIDGYGNKVHWDKVPGETEQEKIDWLQIPKNNIDLAFEMSNGGEDWFQWSGFNNKSYLKFEVECL